MNRFADSLVPVDMTSTPEFESLLESAKDLGIPPVHGTRYVSRHTVVRGLRFHFLEWGMQGAPTVLLLHGGNQSAHSWDLVSLALSARYHVFALDQRGHGDSEWTRDLDYSVEARAADALAFLDDQQITSPLLVGHSMGGHVAMRAVLDRPDLARGLVLVDVGPELSAKGTSVIVDFVTRNVEFDDLEEFVDRVAQYDRFRSREHISRTVKYNMLRRADGKYVSKADHRRVATGRSTPFKLDDFAALPHPVLVVRGEESDVLEAEAAQRFVERLPFGRLATVPRAGHNVHGANTPGFLEAVLPFLDELSS